MDKLEEKKIDEVIFRMQNGETFENIWYELQEEYGKDSKCLEDSKLWLEIVRKTTKGTQAVNEFAPKIIKKDSGVLLEIIEREPKALKEMPELFLEKSKDREFMVEAIKLNPDVIEHMPQQLKNDEEFLNKVVSESGVSGITSIIQDVCPNAQMTTDGKIEIIKTENEYEETEYKEVKTETYEGIENSEVKTEAYEENKDKEVKTEKYEGIENSEVKTEAYEETEDKEVKTEIYEGIENSETLAYQGNNYTYTLSDVSEATSEFTMSEVTTVDGNIMNDLNKDLEGNLRESI